MTTADRKAEAARYIDRVVALNERYGGSRQVSPVEYQRAVEQAAAMSARVRPVLVAVEDAKTTHGLPSAR
jgi:hypothetical protein